MTGVLGAVSFAGIAAASGLAPGSVKIPSCYGKRPTIVVTKDGKHVYGTKGADVIVVTAPKGAWVDGMGGNDLICGGPGNDHLIGGDGKDKIQGNGGDNIIEGGTGNDTLIGHAGDTLIGGTGLDRFTDGAPALGSQLVPGGAAPTDAAVIKQSHAGDIVDGVKVTASSYTPAIELPAEDLGADLAAEAAVPAPLVAPVVQAPVVAPPASAAPLTIGTGCPVPGVAAVATPGGTTGITYPQGAGSWAPAPPATDAPSVTLQAPASAVPVGTVSIPATGTGPAAASWVVDFGDGEVRNGTGATPGSLVHVYKTPGSYVVSLTALGAHTVTTTSATVVVSGAATTAVLLPQPGTQVQQNAPTTFDLTGSFPAAGKDLVSATVDFGDCSPIATLTGAPTSWTSVHSYAALGPHTVTVTVTDSAGTVSTASATIDVVAPPVVAPVAAADSSAAAPAAAPTTGDWSSEPASTVAIAPVAPSAPTVAAGTGSWG
jgi:PKD repeat protein